MSSIPLPMCGPPVDAGIPLPMHEQDPYELVGMVLPGDEGQTESMARAFIEEFILLGWNQKQLMSLFASPLYLGTHRIYQEKGEPWVRALIEEVWVQLTFVPPAVAETEKQSRSLPSSRQPHDRLKEQ